MMAEERRPMTWRELLAELKEHAERCFDLDSPDDFPDAEMLLDICAEIGLPGASWAHLREGQERERRQNVLDSEGSQN